MLHEVYFILPYPAGFVKGQAQIFQYYMGMVKKIGKKEKFEG